MIDDRDREYMALALSLAEKGRGTTSPNPMVGAVIVRDGAIIGRGWHARAGGPHAEVAAVNNAGGEVRGADMYVTLEPCNHHGRTPPCTELIIRHGMRRVVVAMTDPNPLVAGKGCDRIREDGIEVEVGLMEDAARKLNEAFIKHIVTGMPFLTLKLAVTLDGFIADSEGQSKWITGAEARKLVHGVRAESDAIMVGSGTVSADNPSLNVRDAEGEDPLRVLIDSKLNIAPDARVLADGHAIIAATDTALSEKESALLAAGAEVWRFPSDNGRVPLMPVLNKLGERGVMTVLCEGGAGLASSLIAEGLVDKLVMMIAPKVLGRGVSAFSGFDPGGIEHALVFGDVESLSLDGDTVITCYPQQPE